MKNKKLIIVVCTIVAVIVIIGVIALFAIKKSSDDVVENKESYSWPSLSGYGIPNFSEGKIVEYYDFSNSNDWVMNYSIKVDGVKEKEIKKYVESFDSSWNVIYNDNQYTISLVDGKDVYSVVIKEDTKNKSAKFIISSIER